MSRLHDYHKALSECRHLYKLPKFVAKAENVFVTKADRKAAEAITEAHRRRLQGSGSPSECDDVARRVAG